MLNQSLLTRISQVFVGGLFIFSGLVKMNDPVGFSFKLEEYFSEEVLSVSNFRTIGLTVGDRFSGRGGLVDWP